MLPSDTSYADAGSAIHKAIAEYYHSIGSSPNRNNIQTVFTTILDRVWASFGLDSNKNLTNRKLACRTNFINFEIHRLQTWKRYRPDMVEAKLETNIQDITFVTVVDAYWEQDETIIDWKSGNMSMLSESEYMQGQVMKIILQNLHKKVSKIMFIGLLNGLRLEMPHIDDSYVFERIARLREFVEANHFPRIRGSHCYWCGNVLRCELNEKGVGLWSEV